MVEPQLSQVIKVNTEEKNQQGNTSKLLQMKQSQTKVKGKTIDCIKADNKFKSRLLI